MPSPVAHSLTGYVIYRAAGPVHAQRWQYLVLYLFAANAPDLDFLPGLLVGDPDLYHHGVSHSIGFAVLFASALSLFLLFLKRDPIRRNFLIFFCLYSSHVVLDWLSVDTAFPYGVPFLWPLTDEYFIAPLPFLPDVSRASSSGISFITSLFSLHNFWTVAVEFLLFFPFVWLVSIFRNQQLSQHEEKIFDADEMN
jgi:inner membrane protein